MHYLVNTIGDPPAPCGAWGYHDTDYDEDCDVDLDDYELFQAHFWDDNCIDPCDVSCMHPWP